MHVLEVTVIVQKSMSSFYWRLPICRPIPKALAQTFTPISWKFGKSFVHIQYNSLEGLLCWGAQKSHFKFWISAWRSPWGWESLADSCHRIPDRILPILFVASFYGNFNIYFTNCTQVMDQMWNFPLVGFDVGFGERVGFQRIYYGL